MVVDELDEHELGFVGDPSNASADPVNTQEDEGFNGSYQHSLDQKGRVIVPAKMRSLLGSKFVIGPSYDFTAIALYPKEKWLEMRSSIREAARFNSAMKKYMEFFNGMSYRDQEYDIQGRVVLPALLRERLLKGDTKELDLMGCEDYIRIDCHETDTDSFYTFKANMDATMDIWNEIKRMQANNGKGDERT